MNATTSSPCVYIGQCSSLLCDEVAKVSLALSSSTTSTTSNSNSNIVDNGLYGTKIDSTMLLERLMKVLERLENVTCVHYVGDLGLDSSVLNDIADLLPGVSLRSLHISPIDKVHGISAVNSIMNLQASLYTSDAVMVREFDDIQQLMAASGSKEQQEGHLSNYLSYMAADVFIAFRNSSSGISSVSDALHHSSFSNSWPITVCSSRKKLYDVRSSLWRYLRITSNKKNEYSALRAMATNLHSLHTAANQKLSSKYIEAADLVSILHDNSANKWIYSNAKSSTADVKVALDWATPHVHWPKLGSNTSMKMAEPYVSSASSVVSDISRNTIFSSAPPTSSTGTDATSTTKEISAIAFESQYAAAAISSICQKAHSILEIGAFSHSFRGYGVDDALDALEYVHDYISK